MEELAKQLAQLNQNWQQLSQVLRGNPPWLQQQAPGLTVDQIDEVMKSIQTWLERVEQPPGFRPTFHVAKTAASTNLAQAILTSRAVIQGQPNSFPNFVNALTNITTGLHSMIIHAGRNDSRRAAADLSAELAQGLSLLDTAQNEIRQKAVMLDAVLTKRQTAEERISSADKHDQDLQALLNKSGEALTDLIDQTKIKTDQVVSEADKGMRDLASRADQIVNATSATVTVKSQSLVQLEEKWTEKEQELSNLVKQANSLGAQLEEQQDHLKKLQEANEKQRILIDDLLPKGASAGLAAGFEKRAAELKWTKISWMASFMLSIIGLVGVAAWLATETSGVSATQVWLSIVQRLPFAAPMIWLGWFSAVQYGNAIRVQEDYAFKAAPSKAFAGYRDHMDHMNTVAVGEAKTALTLLAARTIEILSHEPLRIYNRSERDVSPSQQVISLLDKGIATSRNGSPEPHRAP